jgi:hypothetical protein
VYAHQTDNTHISSERHAKIEAQKDLYTSTTYAQICKGNEMADLLAKSVTGTPNPPIPDRLPARDVEKDPPLYTDIYYLTYKENESGNRAIFDGSRHKLMRDIATDKILAKHLKTDGSVKPGGRNQSLAAMLDPAIDPHLSTASRWSPLARDQQAFAVVYKIRSHAALTAVKGHNKVNWLKNDNPYKKYYQALFPSQNCIYCEEALPAQHVPEHTAHLLSCPNHTTRPGISIDLWRDCYDLIEKSIDPDLVPIRGFAPATAARLIAPFVLPSVAASQRHLNVANCPNNGALLELSAFNGERASLGFIPSALTRALTTVGVPISKAKATARLIACRIHRAIAAIFCDRTRHLHRKRNQRKLHRTLVHGRAYDERSLPSSSESSLADEPSSEVVPQAADSDGSSPLISSLDDG